MTASIMTVAFKVRLAASGRDGIEGFTMVVAKKGTRRLQAGAHLASELAGFMAHFSSEAQDKF